MLHRCAGSSSGCFVSEGCHAFPAQSVHKGGHALVDATPCSLLCGYLFQPNAPVNVRFRAAQQGTLQACQHSAVGIGQLAHEVHGQPLHNVRLGAGEVLALRYPARCFSTVSPGTALASGRRT